MLRQLFLLLAILTELCVFSNEVHISSDFPVLYKGRFRPAEAYARLWLYDHYHASKLKTDDLEAFHTDSKSPLALLWSLDIQGNSSYQDSPLFWIKLAEMKQLVGLPLKQDRFSYHQLMQPYSQSQISNLLTTKQNQKAVEEWGMLSNLLKEFGELKGSLSSTETAFRQRFTQLQADARPPNEIALILEQEYPLSNRLKQAGPLFKALPGRPHGKEWYALQALEIQTYDPISQSLRSIGNFTIYPDLEFKKIQDAYLNLIKTWTPSSFIDSIHDSQEKLSFALHHAYQFQAGQVYQEAHGKHLLYPSMWQLKIESLYVSYSWIPILIVLYLIAACSLMLTYHHPLSIGYRFSMAMMVLAILCHTILILVRCYILGRPPVSNMFETVIYVPWVAACASLLLPVFRKNPFALLAACISSICLLIILEITDLNQNLDQVQAVLDSQFWLIIHVLLVVGSYGIYILGAILGHFYLSSFLIYRKETPAMKNLAKLILQTMYGGTILLVSGTILGGIWAAESWGRFWDWDPKESWAFISSCLYLIWIHAYRFHRIHSFGLAIGSISGLLAISFTWYGVNYILGAGLHSYGFGSGGEKFYYAFLITECLFLGLATWIHFYTHMQKSEINL